MGKDKDDDQSDRWADALERMSAPDETNTRQSRMPDSPPSLPEPEVSLKPSDAKPRNRPATPQLSHTEQVDSEDYGIEPDRVNVPPHRPMDSFVKRKLSQRVANTRQTSLHHRQTIVPILLTTGVMFPVLAGLWCLTDVDSPFRKVGIWAPITLLSIGLVTLVLGFLNALQLREMLHPKKAR